MYAAEVFYSFGRVCNLVMLLSAGVQQLLRIVCKVALTACVRKMVTILNAMVRDDRLWKEAKVFSLQGLTWNLYRLVSHVPGQPTPDQWGTGEETQPALCHLLSSPIQGLINIDPQHQMLVFGYHRIGADINGEGVTQLRQTIHHPALTVLVGSTTELILSAQEGTPYTAADAVVVRRRLKRNLLAER